MSTQLTQRVKNITWYKNGQDGGGEIKSGLPRGSHGIYGNIHHAHYYSNRAHDPPKPLAEHQQPSDTPADPSQHLAMTGRMFTPRTRMIT